MAVLAEQGHLAEMMIAVLNDPPPGPGARTCGNSSPGRAARRSVGVGEQEVGYRQVVDAAGPVTGKRVQGDYVLGVVVGDGFQGRVFAATCLGRRGDRGGDLDVDGVLLAPGDEVDLGRSDLPDGDVVAAAAQLEPDDVLQHSGQPPVGVAEQRVHDAVVTEIVLLVGSEQC